MSEKKEYDISAGSADHGSAEHGIKNIVQEKGVSTGEAADLYGDLQTAEEYGYVKRGLKSRHIQFIALGGTIGTGLFLGIGTAFAHAGPVSFFSVTPSPVSQSTV